MAYDGFTICNQLGNRSTSDNCSCQITLVMEPGNDPNSLS